MKLLQCKQKLYRTNKTKYRLQIEIIELILNFIQYNRKVQTLQRLKCYSNIIIIELKYEIIFLNKSASTRLSYRSK